jgi:CRISPR-associated protein Cmr3
MKIRIEPLDPLFFRDGRPFTMGEDDWTTSAFPPSPGVIYGALRSIYFSHHPDQLSLAQTDADPTAKLRLNSVYLLAGSNPGSEQPLFPFPLDIVQVTKNIKEALPCRPLVLEPRDGIATGYPLSWILVSREQGKDVQTPDNCLIDQTALKEYLLGEREKYKAVEMGNYICREPKVGIARDPSTSAAQEHKLYRVIMHRLKQMCIGVEYEGLDLPAEGFMRLGGEARAAYYTQLSAESVSLQIPAETKLFKLYLSTPAFFDGGWRPGWIDPPGYSGSKDGIKVQLLAAATGKPQSIGGFDVKQGIPKKMRRAVPAGSVYYFKILDGQMADAVKVFDRQSISESRSEEGFGIVFVGLLAKSSLDAVKQGGE